MKHIPIKSPYKEKSSLKKERDITYCTYILQDFKHVRRAYSPLPMKGISKKIEKCAPQQDLTSDAWVVGTRGNSSLSCKS